MFDGYEDDALTWSNAVIVESISECRAISKRGVSNRYDRMRRIPPGVDTDSFRPDKADPELRKRYGAGEDDKVLLYVGRLAARKGVDALLDVFAKVVGEYPECVLVIVGDGPNREALQSQARQLGVADRVTFALEVPFPVLQGLYATADLYVMHSLWEGWGLIFAEAMASGTPCVTTDVGGVPEMIRDGVDGYVVKLHEKDRMAGRIVRLLRDEELRAGMSRRCHRRMLDMFSWNVIAADTERLYREVLADPHNRKGRCSVGQPCLEQRSP
jgi:phosphatidylinositol alpha-1,6-mannosyltransferase